MKTNYLFLLSISFLFLFTGMSSVSSQSQADFPFLADEINPNNCCNNETVILYSTPAADFIYIQNNEECFGGGGRLFLGDGTFYCEDNRTTTCLDFYGLSNGTVLYECTSDTPGNIDLFDRFPFLSSVVDVNNCGGEMFDFFRNELGHEFLCIVDGETRTWYYGTGQVACIGSPTFDCVSAYGFTDMELIETFVCEGDDNGGNAEIKVAGFTYFESNLTYDESVNTITDALTAAGPINIAAQVDHTANAASIDRELNNTSVILFGNPALGTPLMQNNQLTGLDLPQKYLVFEDDEGLTRVAFNDADYLSARHGLEGEASLATINGALRNFAGMTSDTEAIVNDNAVGLAEGITTKVSNNSFDDTYASLIAAISGNDALRIVLELDHQANAASVDLDLPPTRLIVFGNPNLGTPLMQNSQTVGLDLPQKFLVWESPDGIVNVSYNDPAYLASRHNLSGVDELLTTITGALNNLSNAATN